jgi:hypothetical protein
MPYIGREKRPAIDEKIDPLIDYLKSLPVESQDGSLNYAITRIIRHVYPQKYFHFNRALGVLTAVTQELYRRVIGPYEDTKISENGDVK